MAASGFELFVFVLEGRLRISIVEGGCGCDTDEMSCGGLQKLELCKEGVGGREGGAYGS